MANRRACCRSVFPFSTTTFFGVTLRRIPSQQRTFTQRPAVAHCNRPTPGPTIRGQAHLIQDTDTTVPVGTKGNPRSTRAAEGTAKHPRNGGAVLLQRKDGSLLLFRMMSYSSDLQLVAGDDAPHDMVRTESFDGGDTWKKAVDSHCPQTGGNSGLQFHVLFTCKWQTHVSL